MARIPTPTVEEAPARSRPLLAEVDQRLGAIPNFYRVVSNSPAALEAVLGFQATLQGGALDGLVTERIALTVAEVNGCDYCLSAQTYRTRRAGLLDDAEITANRNGASNDITVDAALRFAKKLARERGHVTERDVDDVKRAGYSDAEIVEIVAHVALNVFTNFINEALKTEIDFPKVGTRRPT
ncbi:MULTISPECIES: carboxymuconolactone decarboxylase family protein [Nitrospirillum]|uniref:Putative peroxidase-related enzyme n=1 Tax=Nitrospirillum amazonense TaxID=28077 RepID=A0A560GDW4_9PROT|nr:carboxymuconolactone decarboxylase family protein [Nitrospirillum amazonense]MEC4590982.1 carboxymuconolactone decarboxylase family protein [Nitrospirillum amazonense]TWB32105.1 putative peroxidase-related enzyme [Nitrospirillum amazonense]